MRKIAYPKGLANAFKLEVSCPFFLFIAYTLAMSALARLKAGRIFIALFIAFILIPLYQVASQSPSKGKAPKRLLIIESQSGEPYESTRLAMIEQLALLGYSEKAGSLSLRQYSLGNNIQLIKRVESMEGAAINGYDAIILNGTIAVQGAKSLWLGDRSKKFVYLTLTDPIGEGLLEAFGSYPSANFTGLAYPVPVAERLRAIQRFFPKARRIGFIYGDMPQSRSYLLWLEATLAQPEFKILSLLSRKIDFISGERGTLRMCQLAGEEAAGIEASVDIFLSPNDQMGINPEYPRALSAATKKPLIGLSLQEIEAHLGAVLAVYSDTKNSGRRAALMLGRLFEGTKLETIRPEQAAWDIAIDSGRARSLGLRIGPEYLPKLR